MTHDNDVNVSLRRIRQGAPQFGANQARLLLTQHLGADAAARWTADGIVPGETDANIVFRSGPETIVLKVAHAADHSRIELQNEVLAFLSTDRASYDLPQVLLSAAGRGVELVTQFGHELAVRVLTWVPGSPVADRSLSDEALDDIGRAAGSLAARLARFAGEPVQADSELYWDLDVGTAVLQVGRDALGDDGGLVDRVLALVETARNQAGPLPRALVHNDLNTFNILVDTHFHRTRVTGIIDFGDITVTSRVNDAAILLSAVCRGRKNFVGTACRVLAAYHRETLLSAPEIDMVFPLVVLRLATVFATTTTSTSGDPRHRRSVERAQLDELMSLDPVIVGAHLRAACGAPIDDARVRSLSGLENPPPVTSIVRGDVVVIDRTSRAGDVVKPGDSPHDSVAVGRFAEPQYDLSAIRSRDVDRRDIALSVRVLGPAGAAVRAPFDGVARLDADGTVVVDHRGSGFEMWTRYRGLHSPVAGAVTAGAQLGEVGAAPTSAQILIEDPDLVDVPWFASEADRDVLEQFAPDASILFGPSAVTRWVARRDDVLNGRHRFLPRTHPTYFDEPMDMVRATGCWFIDENGNRYLDALNNVTLLGHCHPRVTAAAERQLSTLQTNSRFVYDSLTDYTQALTKTLPADLDVVYMLNSGSEANDLALRMARYATGREDIVVIEDAYHGYTTTVSDVSPSRYKHYGKPDTTHAVPNPDQYRGTFGYDDRDAGTKYADQVIDEFDRLIDLGRPPAAFIYEALLAAGGQVVLPPGYLARIHDAARERGILTIADEVQVGFGRLGSAFWGFQTQGPSVVPDFVSMGKSMGNGFPVAAMVTTRALSQTFDATGRFFSTYGGNPTACVVASETLSVLQEEDLQENARVVGEYLRAGLRGLMDTHEIIGDVRGQGFYSGVEFVSDRLTKEHAIDETLTICNRMKDSGVLVYPTGPKWNILKIKPPLSFTGEYADMFISALDDVLTAGW